MDLNPTTATGIKGQNQKDVNRRPKLCREAVSLVRKKDNPIKESMVCGQPSQLPNNPIKNNK